MSGHITSLDLFAGAGGLTAGLHASSSAFDTLRAVEHDIAAAATFEANHGNNIVYAGSIEDWLTDDNVPTVDLVVGGPPCQGFSRLNRARVGLERNMLWQRYAETLVRAQPKWFVMENVAAFMSTPEFQELSSWARPGGALADWSIDVRILTSSDYGSAQRRQRAVVLGTHRDLPPLRWPAPLSTSEPTRTVRHAIDDLRGKATGIDLPDRKRVFQGLELPGAFRTDELHLTRRFTPLSKERFKAIPEGGNRFNLPEHLKSPCWIAHTSGSGDVMGRLHWNKPSVTIRTEFFKPEKGRYLHPEEDRSITHHEAARLQGFPDDYLWVGSKGDIARQIGNAVPLEMARALGRSILNAAGHCDTRGLESQQLEIFSA